MIASQPGAKYYYCQQSDYWRHLAIVNTVQIHDMIDEYNNIYYLRFDSTYHMYRMHPKTTRPRKLSYSSENKMKTSIYPEKFLANVPQILARFSLDHKL